MSSFIDAINQGATAKSSASSSATSKETVLGKQDFLTLLVAQLQNQDPLNPDNPTEFTAQLAQFSSLEQLFNLNKSMDNLVTSNANSDRLSTLNTIGKEVVYQDGSFDFTGEPVKLGYKLDGQASEVTLSLQLDGATVATLKGVDLAKGNHFLTWDGMTDSGQAAAHGNYKIVIQAKAAEGESVAANPLIRSEVTGVDLTGDYGGVLITKAGKVGFNTILGVYDKDATNTTTTSTDSSTAKTVASTASLAPVDGTSQAETLLTEEEKAALELLDATGDTNVLY
jgi:flagellar basal-body rod modification protein FlgD